jgi:hypothetical protein
MLPMLVPDPATTSAIVAAVKPRVPNASVAASKMCRWVSSVLAQRRARGWAVPLRAMTRVNAFT